MTEAFVVDIGGTKTTAALVDKINSDIKVLNKTSFSTLSNPVDEIKKINEIYLTCKNIDCLALSLPGKWNSEGVLNESYFLKHWIDYPFVKNLVSSIGIKKYIFETDVICGALGEYHSRGCKDKSMLYLNLGTGIGAAYIDQNGQPFKPLKSPGLRLQKLVYPYDDELFPAVDLISGGMLGEISGFQSVEILFDEYKNGDVKAIDVISKSQLQLASWLINLFYLFAPDLIVLNGGLVQDFEVIAEEAIDIAKEEISDEIEILPSLLNDLAPVYGAYVNLITN